MLSLRSETSDYRIDFRISAASILQRSQGALSFLAIGRSDYYQISCICFKRMGAVREEVSERPHLVRRPGDGASLWKQIRQGSTSE